MRRIIQQLLLVAVLHTKEMKICPADISKIDPDCEKQVILLIIPNEEKKVGIILG